VSGGLSTFYEVGQALLEIRERKLYRAAFSSWDAYCKLRWGFGRSQGYRLITAAILTDQRTAAGEPPPENEHQARLQQLRDKALETLTPEEQRAVIEADEHQQTEADAREARQQDGAGQAERVKQGERLLKRAAKVFRGLGPEGEQVCEWVEKALAAAREIVTI